MKIFRNCIFIGLLAAFTFLLLVISYSFFLPDIPLSAIVLAAAAVFIIFELGILAGVVIMKMSRIGRAEGPNSFKSV